MDATSLLEETYQNAVTSLLEKYGPAKDDYFAEKSYKRFKAGEIKTLAKKKITRTDEGLYCHHIDEDKQIMVSSPSFIKMYNIPFEYQTRERLVYCNLAEHAVLHVLIAAETRGIPSENRELLGIGGYVNLIRPQLIQWLINGVAPKHQWEINCRNAAYMTPENAKKLVETMDEFLLQHYPAISRKNLDAAYEKYMAQWG